MASFARVLLFTLLALAAAWPGSAGADSARSAGDPVPASSSSGEKAPAGSHAVLSSFDMLAILAAALPGEPKPVLRCQRVDLGGTAAPPAIPMPAAAGCGLAAVASPIRPAAVHNRSHAVLCRFLV